MAAEEQELMRYACLPAAELDRLVKSHNKLVNWVAELKRKVASLERQTVALTSVAHSRAATIGRLRNDLVGVRGELLIAEADLAVARAELGDGESGDV
jgi:hypothetical protein